MSGNITLSVYRLVVHILKSSVTSIFHFQQSLSLEICKSPMKWFNLSSWYWSTPHVIQAHLRPLSSRSWTGQYFIVPNWKSQWKREFNGKSPIQISDRNLVDLPSSIRILREDKGIIPFPCMALTKLITRVQIPPAQIRLS